jgi:hypothetical protein
MFVFNINKFLESISKGNNLFIATIDCIPKFNKETFKDLFVCAALLFAQFIIMQGNMMDGGRFYLATFLISFFVLTQHKYKKLVFYILCSGYIAFFCFAYIRVFQDGQNDKSIKTVLENINPNHQIKIFHYEKFSKQMLAAYEKKFNTIVIDARYYERDVFAELCEFYKKFNLTPDDKMSLLRYINYASFATNSTLPQPSILFTVPNVTISTDYSSQIVNSLIDAADIIGVTKKHFDEDSVGKSDFFEKTFKDKKEKDFFKFYEGEYFIYYAKRQWLNSHGISIGK